jgi:NADPH:quinone reductase
MTELFGWYARGLVKPAIDSRLPMSALAEAYARMASRQVRGKLLLTN